MIGTVTHPTSYLKTRNFLFEDILQDHPSSDSYLNQFVQVLLEPQSQILGFQYHLSQRLLLVKDIRLAMGFLRNTTIIRKILAIAPEERMTYNFIWFEIIFACAQELKRGALIWNQAMEKNLQNLEDTPGFYSSLVECHALLSGLEETLSRILAPTSRIVHHYSSPSSTPLVWMY